MQNSYEDAAPDWKYDMRRNMQQVVPGLFLGPYSVARDNAQLVEGGITHLLGIVDAAEARFMKQEFDGRTLKLIYATDSLSENLIPHFPEGTAFIDRVMADRENKLLVYCNNGMSRSPSFVIAYLMEALHWDFQTAFGYVQSRRFCISPNDNFKMQLKEYQAIHRAREQIAFQHQHSTPQMGSVTRIVKRRQAAEDDDFADHYADTRTFAESNSGGPEDIEMT